LVNTELFAQEKLAVFFRAPSKYISGKESSRPAEKNWLVRLQKALYTFSTFKLELQALSKQVLAIYTALGYACFVMRTELQFSFSSD